MKRGVKAASGSESRAERDIDDLVVRGGEQALRSRLISISLWRSGRCGSNDVM
jgi:hypothetical protein